MAANNLKKTTKPLNGNLKENPINEELAQQSSPMHTTGALDATTGGQVKGGVTAQSGNRMAAEGGPEGLS